MGGFDIGKLDSLELSSQFDAQLITLGNWSLANRRILNSWLEQTPSDQKARMAAQAISTFALNLMKDDLSIEGRVRIKRLQSASSLLERLVFTTRELEKKFYRDHVNHMLKVALLARVLANKKPFCLNESKLKTLTLASVFHDMAYPLSECGQIFNETLRTLKDCYSVAELFRTSLFREARFDVKSLAKLVDGKINKVRAKVRQMNHGLLSAIEFQSLLDKNALDLHSEVTRAIALHDPDFQSKVDLMTDPILGLLIIADELQDWGRPTDQDIAIIPRIEDFDVADGRVRGRFVARDYRNFSVLKQICSKMKNLRRLHMDSSQLEFRLVYSIDGFEKIDHSAYESVLQILFSSVDDGLMDPSKNIDLSEASFFEKSLFGIEIGMPVKKELYDCLGTRKLPEKTVLKNINIYLNQNISEIIMSKKKLGSISAIELSNDNDDCISARVITDGKTVRGVFHPNMDNLTLKYVQFLAAEVRFVNYMMHEVGGSKLKSYKGFPKFEGLAEQSVVNRVIEHLGDKYFSGEYNSLRLGAVISCLRNRGCFLFA